MHWSCGRNAPQQLGHPKELPFYICNVFCTVTLKLWSSVYFIFLQIINRKEKNGLFNLSTVKKKTPKNEFNSIDAHDGSLFFITAPPPLRQSTSKQKLESDYWSLHSAASGWFPPILSGKHYYGRITFASDFGFNKHQSFLNVYSRKHEIQELFIHRLALWTLNMSAVHGLHCASCVHIRSQWFTASLQMQHQSPANLDTFMDVTQRTQPKTVWMSCLARRPCTGGCWRNAKLLILPPIFPAGFKTAVLLWP